MSDAETGQPPLTIYIMFLLAIIQFSVPPVTSTWPHLRCDVGLKEREY